MRPMKRSIVQTGSSLAVTLPMDVVQAFGLQKGQEVEAVVDRVLKAAPAIADELQSRAGAPAVVRYEPFVLAPTQVDELPATSTMKLVIAVMGVGGLVGAAWSIVADRLLRRRRRPAEPEDADDATPDEPRLAPVRSDEPEAPGTVARDATADAEDDEAERPRSVTVVKRPRSPKSGSATAPGDTNRVFAAKRLRDAASASVVIRRVCQCHTSFAFVSPGGGRPSRGVRYSRNSMAGPAAARRLVMRSRAPKTLFRCSCSSP